MVKLIMQSLELCIHCSSPFYMIIKS